jgi:hypothetical protein
VLKVVAGVYVCDPFTKAAEGQAQRTVNRITFAANKKVVFGDKIFP